jgi:hypothetical protein
MDTNVVNGNFLILGMVFFCVVLMIIDNADYIKSRKDNTKKD